MSAILHQRCWHHASREAVVRCPECRRYYCRECVVEHLGRMICTDCIARSVAEQAAGRFANLRWAGFAVGGFLLAWLIFYYLGVWLAHFPSEFFQ